MLDIIVRFILNLLNSINDFSSLLSFPFLVFDDDFKLIVKMCLGLAAACATFIAAIALYEELYEKLNIEPPVIKEESEDAKRKAFMKKVEEDIQNRKIQEREDLEKIKAEHEANVENRIKKEELLMEEAEKLKQEETTTLEDLGGLASEIVFYGGTFIFLSMLIVFLFLKFKKPIKLFFKKAVRFFKKT